MAEITISAGTITNYRGTSTTLELRAYSNGFLDSSGSVIIEGSPYDLARIANFYDLGAVAISGINLNYSAFTLPSTTDSLNKPTTARWTLCIFDSTTDRLVAVVSGLEGFYLEPTPTTMTLSDIIEENTGTIPSATPGDKTVTGDLTVGQDLSVNGNLVVLGSISGGDAVGDPVTFTGPVVAQSFTGNGAGLTGIPTGTGGVSNTGSTTIAADTDSDGVGVVDLLTRTLTRFRIRNAGQVELFAPLITPGYTLAGLPAVGIVGQVARTTDDTKGLWMDNGTQWVSLFGRMFDVRVCGAKGDGSTDDTTVIQNAITACEAAGGGVVYFPPGTYKVTSLTISASNVCLMGSGAGSRIAKSSATGDTLTISAAAQRDQVRIRDLNFYPLVTRTSGSEIMAGNFANLYLLNLNFQNTYRCMMLGQAANTSYIVYAYGLRAYSFTNFLTLVRVLDAHITDVSTGTDVAAANTFEIDGACESCIFVGCSAANTTYPSATGYALHIKKNLYTTTPARFNEFIGCFFDSHKYGLYAEDDAIDMRFTGCWFAGSDTGAVLTNTGSGNPNDYSFVNCRAYNNGNGGFYFGGNGSILLQGCSVMANNLNANSQAVSGSAGITMDMSSGGKLRVIGCRGGKDTANFPANLQSYALWITATAGTQFIVKDNDFSGNHTGGINNLAGTSSVRIVADNL